MSRARILVVHGGPDEGPGWVAWRLVSGNNRELGRSADVHPDVDTCLADIARVQGAAARLVPRLSTDARHGHWGWALDLDDRRVALSGRRYDREREARASVTHFLAALPAATVPPVPLDGRRSRLLDPETFLGRASA